MDGCPVSALPAIVAEELPDAVAVEGDELEQIYVGSEEVVDGVDCHPEMVYNYVCSNDDTYYSPALDVQDGVSQGLHFYSCL